MAGERWHLLTAGLAAAIALAVLHHAAPASTAQFFTGLHPLAAGLALTAAGLLGLHVLRRPGAWPLPTHRPRPLRQALVAFALALPFCFAVTLADFTLRFPEHISPPGWPSLVFYPAMAVLAVICFHILPAVLIAGLARLIGRRPDGQALAWLPAALPAALVEPVFQVSAALSDGAVSPVSVFTALHVFVFNLAALHLLRNGGFLPALLMRLFYYAWWHILWGNWRLELIFA